MDVPLTRLYDLVPAAERLDVVELLASDAPAQPSLFPDLPEPDELAGDDPRAQVLDADPPTPGQAEAIVRRVLELPPPEDPPTPA